jgi:DNA-binding MarR family transcriptional regulator
LLQKLDALANKQLEFLKASLSEAQSSALVGLLERFSDLHDIPKLKGRSNEHPLRTSIRRGTRALGLTSNAIFGEHGLNALQWHALAEISSTPGALTALQLCEILAVKPNTLSAALSGLERQGCITQVPLETDRRKKALHLTDGGAATLTALKAGGCSRLGERLQAFSIEDLQEFVTLLSLLAGKGGAAPRQLLQAALYVEQVTDKAILTRLRGLYVEHLVERNEHWNLGSTILCEESFIYAGFEQGQPISVAEFVLSDERAVVSNFAVFASGSDVLGVEAFTLAACRTFLALYPFRAVLLPPSLSKIRVEGDLYARAVRDGLLVSLKRE